MQISDKIKLFRQLKGWSREEMAYRLRMSVSGYGSIERGETDINLSKLEKIAEVFEIDLATLFNLSDKSLFQKIKEVNNTNNSGLSSLNINSCFEYRSQNETEQLRLIVEQQAKEIDLLRQQIFDLREIIQLLKKEVTTEEETASQVDKTK